MRYGQGLLEEILRRTDLVQLVGRRGKLVLAVLCLSAVAATGVRADEHPTYQSLLELSGRQQGLHIAR